MKKILLIFAVVLGIPVSAQTIELSEGIGLLQSTPKEKLYVHYNSSLLFPGEYLYYKVYNLQEDTETLNEISKIAYIDLIGEDQMEVFHHQVQLIEGQGQGDFFIPTTLASGNYKLLAYTNWMRNNKTIFQADVVIINPYQGDQQALTPPIKVRDSVKKTSFVSPESFVGTNQKKNHPLLSLALNKSSYQTRDRVTLALREPSSEVSGSFSISVRKIDSIKSPDKPDSDEIAENKGLKEKQDILFLPEFRGKLLSGKIVENNLENNRRRSNVKIAFSVPGEQIYKIATTNEKGVFYINFDEPRINPELLIQILGEDKEFFSVRLDEKPSLKAAAIDFQNFHIIPEMKEWILERSVRNQIENAYYGEKPDTLLTATDPKSFYVKQPQWFVLDAYNRFPSIKETFVEIIQSAWISKNSAKEGVIVVREPDGGRNYNLPPLLLVDGVMVQDHSDFISYPANNVESIGILRENFYIGSHIFEGIVDVRTFDGQFWKEYPKDYLLQKELQVPEAQKQYFQQIYPAEAGESLSLPDQRSQLLWKPRFQLEGEESTTEFYTSDVPGLFEIELEGFTSEGTPISLREYFTVKE